MLPKMDSATKRFKRIACTTSLNGEYFFYPVTAVNIVLAITTCLKNAVILVALQRKNSLHPSSKLMFQCLAVTDLCVGVIAQPLFVIQFASASHNQFQLCFTVLSINDVLGSCLSGVSSVVDIGCNKRRQTSRSFFGNKIQENDHFQTDAHSDDLYLDF